MRETNRAEFLKPGRLANFHAGKFSQLHAVNYRHDSGDRGTYTDVQCSAGRGTETLGPEHRGPTPAPLHQNQQRQNGTSQLTRTCLGQI